MRRESIIKENKLLIKEIVDEVNILGRVISSYREAPRKYGTDDILTEIEARAINLIGDHKNIGVNDLSKITQRTKGATSIMIERLVEKGFIIKKKSPIDQRRFFLTLTDKAEKIHNYHSEANDNYYKKLSKELSEFQTEDFENCIELIKTIRNYWNSEK